MRRLAGIIMLLSLFFVPTAAAQEGSSQHLPTDLLYVLADTTGKGNKLVRLDAQTLQTSGFYEDATASFLQLIAWSPSGQYLAFLRRPTRNHDIVDICFLQQDGKLKTCFNDAFSYHLLTSYRYAADVYSIGWSEDETQVYYVKDSNCHTEVVQAELETGAIQRVLYEQDDDCTSSAPIVYLSPGQRYLALYTDKEVVTSEYVFTVYARSVIIVDLLTGDQYELTAQISGEREPAVFCPGWAPEGDFLSARIYTESPRPGLYDYPFRPEVALVDPTGQITRVLSADLLAAQRIDFIDCPAWNADATSMYFLAGSYDEEWGHTETVSVYQLAIGSTEIVEVGRLEAFGENTSNFPVGPLVVSPDGTHVAFRYRSRQAFVGVGVLLPDGDVERFEYSQPVGSPLWFPDVPDMD